MLTNLNSHATAVPVFNPDISYFVGQIFARALSNCLFLSAWLPVFQSEMNAKSSKHTSGKKVQGSNLRKSKIYSALKISHLPKHFEEEQLRKYFSQFGPVYGIYLPRSKKTLNARDKAFILVDKEIAPIIASTVHNVLNFNRIMKCCCSRELLPELV
ncbi:putative RNA-binding protein [Echinococcus granulosus]|nr:putative RNA-binding protein [Echinococcus granulosus]